MKTNSFRKLEDYNVDTNGSTKTPLRYGPAGAGLITSGTFYVCAEVSTSFGRRDVVLFSFLFHPVPIYTSMISTSLKTKKVIVLPFMAFPFIISYIRIDVQKTLLYPSVATLTARDIYL